jgi:hypothetical protein
MGSHDHRVRPDAVSQGTSLGARCNQGPEQSNRKRWSSTTQGCLLAIRLHLLRIAFCLKVLIHTKIFLPAVGSMTHRQDCSGIPGSVQSRLQELFNGGRGWRRSRLTPTRHDQEPLDGVGWLRWWVFATSKHAHGAGTQDYR